MDWPPHILRKCDRLSSILIRMGEVLKRFWLHLDGKARLFRRHVGRAFDPAGIDEMLVQVIDIFDHTTLLGTGDHQIVDHRQVLDIFAKTNAL